LLAVHADKLRAGLEGNVLCWQKLTGETSVGGKMSRGKCSTPCEAHRKTGPLKTRWLHPWHCTTL